MLHHIQKTILDTLATTESCRYSELKPADLDGNTFGYHLKLAIRDGYVVKHADGSYALSAKGRDLIVHRYEDPTRSAHTIFVIILKRGDNYLMRRRLVQPLLGMSGFVHGEPVPDEPVAMTAVRRLKEKTGISTKLKPIASGTVAIFRSDELMSYSHIIVLSGETDDEITIHQDATGENFWVTKDALQDDAVLPSCIDLLDVHSWFELSYAL